MSLWTIYKKRIHRTLETHNSEVNILIYKEYDKEAILRESSQNTENSQYGDDSRQLDFLIHCWVLGIPRLM